MANRPGDDGQPVVSSTTSTTTSHGPQTTTTTTHSASPGATVTSHGPNSTTITHPTITTTTQFPQSSSTQYRQFEPPPPEHPRLPQQQAAQPQPSQPQPTAAAAAPATRSRTGSIRLRRPSSARDLPVAQPAPVAQPLQSIPQAQLPPTSPPPQLGRDDSWLGQGNRRRSSSEPQRPSLALLEAEHDLRRHPTATTPLQPLYEDGAQSGPTTDAGPPPTRGGSKRMRPGMRRMSSAINLRRKDHRRADHDIDNDMVDMLDVIDPEVSTLTTLNNVQNSLFLPNLPWLYNRQPTYDLMQSSSDSSDEEMGERRASQTDRLTEMTQPGEHEQATRAGLHRTNTIDSTLSTLEEGPDHHFAVLPHGASLPGWSQEEKDALDDHVRHLLHSRRAKFKRTMRGFGHYCRNPLGFIVTLYFFLITFWGAAWVLFLIGWISVGGRQAYFVEICDQILTALFCVVGITMFPFRLYDTYHMAFVAFFAHRTWRLRKERGLKDLRDHNELPAMPPQSVSSPYDTAEEIEEEERMEAPVLTDEEQRKLEYHQGKLAKSHTFYRPHETYTHHAFSIRLLITIVVLLDCHSMFQIALGGTTWGIYYKVRPKALTAVILACSLSCNIASGIIIGIGDKRSRKTLVVEQMMRQGLTEEALKKLRKERGLKARGMPAKGTEKQIREAIGEKKRNPLSAIFRRG